MMASQNTATPTTNMDCPPAFDRAAIRSHFEMLHRLACGQNRIIPLCVFGEDPITGRKVISTVQHFKVGDVSGMTDAAIAYENHPHANIYAPLAVMRPDLPRGDKGSERDVTAVLGAVIDHDADAGRNANEPHEAGYVIETSQRPVSNRQYFVLFDQPLSPVEAKPIVEGLHVAYGGDHGTKDLSHVWRVAGTLNWPNKKKLERGRPAEPQSPTVLKAWHGECVT